jgi:hypothetical protein
LDKNPYTVARVRGPFQRLVLFVLPCLCLIGALYGPTASAAEEPVEAEEPAVNEVSDSTVWCLDSENLEHVSGAAVDLFESVRKSGPNVRVENVAMTLKQWQREDPAAFDEACDKAFTSLGPEAESESDGLDPEEWAIPVGSALAGAVIGGLAGYGASVRRDHKLWQREDARTMRRLAVELQYRAEALAGANLERLDGIDATARIKGNLEELAEFLPEDHPAQRDMGALRGELGKHSDIELAVVANLAQKICENLRSGT